MAAGYKGGEERRHHPNAAQEAVIKLAGTALGKSNPT
jgi:hypothetical protein